MAETFRFPDPANPAQRIRWRSWGRPAFDEAARTDRPILLSLTAVWSEWCRRMDQATFGDAAVVRILDEELIPVRVDADLYPHVQDRYVAGGWPTNAFLTPTGEVLWSGTYVPPEQFHAVARGVIDAWRERRADLEAEIDLRRKALEAARARHTAVGLVRREAADDVLAAAQDAFDARNGGFGPAPRFPHGAAVEALLTLGTRTRNPDWLAMAERTLDGILAGELRDPDGGFFRYATAADWTEPRREKLLETNAALARAYGLGAKLVGRSDWREVAESTVEWVERALALPDGLWAASLMVDGASGGDAPHATPSSGADPVVFARSNAAWIRALADAGGWLGEDAWVDRAAAALDRLLESVAAPGDLLHHYRVPGEAPELPGLLADQVEAARAGVAVAQATGRLAYLREARRLVDGMERAMWSRHGGFVDHVPGPADLGALRYPDRPFETNADAACLLLDLALVTGERGYRAVAERTLALLSPFAGRYGVAGTSFALAVEAFFESPVQVMVIGNDETAAALRRAALRLPVPGGRVWTLERGGRIGRLEFSDSGGSAAYVCGSRSCSPPIRTVPELAAAAAAAR